MRTFIVTRHPGAVEWIRRHLNIADAVVLRHVDEPAFGPGDRVCGVLPLALAARICAAGAQPHVLSYDVPESLRGQELSASMLERLGARLVHYDVREVPVAETEHGCLAGGVAGKTLRRSSTPIDEPCQDTATAEPTGR